MCLYTQTQRCHALPVSVFLIPSPTLPSKHQLVVHRTFRHQFQRRALSKSCELVEIDGKGLGVVAVETIAAGQRVLQLSFSLDLHNWRIWTRMCRHVLTCNLFRASCASGNWKKLTALSKLMEDPVTKVWGAVTAVFRGINLLLENRSGRAICKADIEMFWTCRKPFKVELRTWKPCIQTQLLNLLDWDLIVARLCQTCTHDPWCSTGLLMRSRTRSINWTTPSPSRSLWKASSGSSRGSSADPQSYLDYYIYINKIK